MKKAIYLITNKINSKQYVGQTIHPEKRWWEHQNRAAAHRDEYPIHLAINKYGADNFNFEVLEWTENYDQREQELINYYNTLSPNGYNLTPGGPAPIFYGEDHPNNTLSNEQVDNIIKALQEDKLTDRKIAELYQTTDKIVADINHGRTHRKKELQYPLRIRHGSQKLKLPQVEEIKQLLKESAISLQNIGEQYNVTKGAIWHINVGRTYYDKNEKYPLRSNCNE